MIKYIITHWELIRDSSRNSTSQPTDEAASVDDKCSAASRCVWDLENEA